MNIYGADSNNTLVLSRLYMATPSWLVLHLYRLQSVINAAQGLTYAVYVFRTTSPMLIHWLRSPDRAMFKVVVSMYKALHGSAPTYLSRLVHISDLPGRRSLRSARSSRQLVQSVRLSTSGGRAFPLWVCLYVYGTICQTM